MDNYRRYLIEIGITPGMYISRMVNLLYPYLNWLKENKLTLKQAKYKHLINFIGALQKQEKSKFHINRTLQTITHYYNFKELPNIAQSTRLKGIPRTQPQNLLTAEELDFIFENFQPKINKGYYYHSDKLILGLIIYQALDMREFLNIELNDLHLEKGQIYIREYRQKRSRTIPLKASQILALNTFLLQLRPEIVKKNSDKLLSPQADNYNLLHWQFKKLSKELKKQIKEKLNIEITKLSQLRQSRIAIWTQEEDLRKVQYLAGFRRVSSAERYQKADLSDLKEQVKIFHPLG